MIFRQNNEIIFKYGQRCHDTNKKLKIADFL